MSSPSQSAGPAAICLVGVVESSWRSRLRNATCRVRALRKNAPNRRSDRAAHERLAAKISRQINNLTLSAAHAPQIESSKPAESGPRPE